jgi:WD40 repeat protein
VLTPDSVASRVCNEELAHASTLNKRIIPVLRRAVDGVAMPAELERPNWILAREDDDFEAALAALITAIETDEDWLDMHARLTQRTAEWLAERRDASYLLRGNDLRAAERWLDDDGEHAERPTSDQVAYVNAGRRAAARRQRLLLGGVVLALGVSIALGIAAYVQRQTARSQAFAARAIDAARRDPEEGLRLALQAADLGDGSLVARALRETVAAAGWTRILAGDERAPLTDVAVSPDGSRAVTAADDGSAVVWDLARGRRVASLHHGGAVHGARFSPDGTRIVTASRDGTARVWDVSGRELRVLRPGPRDVWSADFDSSGRRVITATEGGAAQVWRLPGGEIEKRLPASGDNHLALTSLSPDGRRALTSGARNSVRVWTLGPRPRSTTLRLPSGSGTFATVAAFSPDGRRVLVGGDGGSVCLWSLAPTQAARTCHAQEQAITDVAFTADGTRFLAASGDGTTVVRRTSGGARVARLRQAGAVNGAAFSPDGRHVVTGGDDRRVRVWSTRGRPEQNLRGHTDSVSVVRFDPSGTRVLTGSDDGTARVWPSRGDVRTLPGRPLPAADVAFSPDSRKLLAVDVRGRAAIWDLRRGTRVDLALASSELGQPPCDRFTGCGPWDSTSDSVAGASASGVPGVWASDDGRLSRLPWRDASGAAYSPDGRRVAIVRYDRPALVIDGLGDGSPITVPRGSRAAEQSATLTDDGRRLLTVTGDGEARVSSATRGTSAGPGARATAEVAGGAAMTRDGSLLAVGTPAGVLEVHDVRSGARRAARPGRSIKSVAFDRAGDRLVAVSDDLAARVWDPGDLRVPLAVLRGHDDRVLSAELSPDGRFVLTASADGTARLWDPALETTVAVFAKPGLGGARFSPDGRSIAVGGETVHVQTCTLCAPSRELVRLARGRLPAG